MKILTADKPLNFSGHSIFLAGPTPRKDDVKSWRPDAINVLGTVAYQGTVLVPEREDWKTLKHYEDQVEWEDEALARASVIVFWVPRQIPDMMALTTNVEFGRWLQVKPEAIFYGRPPEAPHCRYLDWLYFKKTQKYIGKTLGETILSSLNIVRIKNSLG